MQATPLHPAGFRPATSDELQTVEGGATAIEYGLIAAGISLAIIAVVNGLGPKLNNTFTNVANGLPTP
jgi:pilus assembly protein Flp/PilA